MQTDLNRRENARKSDIVAWGLVEKSIIIINPIETIETYNFSQLFIFKFGKWEDEFIIVNFRQPISKRCVKLFNEIIKSFD